jgi:exosome complex component CSL4
MKKKRIKNGDHVVPGDRLGVIEEFIPGTGTFQDEDDVIYSTITGRVQIDMQERKISVKPTTRQPVYPKRNDVIFGEIQHVSKKSAIVNIHQIGDIMLPVPFSGYLYVKNSAGSFVEQMRDLFAPGDYIIARVQQQTEGLAQLSTVGPKFGVCFAYCSRCGEPLHKTGRRLECFECGNIERRKVASNYGKFNDQEKKPDQPEMEAA